MSIYYPYVPVATYYWDPRGDLTVWSQNQYGTEVRRIRNLPSYRSGWDANGHYWDCRPSGLEPVPTEADPGSWLHQEPIPTEDVTEQASEDATKQSPERPITGKRTLIEVGINYKGTSSALYGCINDAVNMVAWLTPLGYDVHLLVDDNVSGLPASVKSVAKPTRANIINTLTLLIKESQPGDSIVFHYSGHGVSLPASDPTEKDRMDEAMCPVDMEFILDNELYQILALAPAGVKVTAFFDSCHSGTGLDLPVEVVVREVRPPLLADVILISGSTDVGLSADAVVDGKPAGAMTSALLKMVGPMSSHPGGYQSSKTVTQLVRDMRQWLSSRRFSQVPMLSTSKSVVDQLVTL